MSHSYGHVGRVGYFAVSLLAFAQEQSSPRLKPEQIVGNPSFLGQTVECVGVVDRVERDGLSATTFFVVLEGDLYCRLLIEPLRAGKRKVNFKKLTTGVVGVYVDETRVFVPGEELVIRGRVVQEMRRTVLDRTTVKEASSLHLRIILGLPLFWYRSDRNP